MIEIWTDGSARPTNPGPGGIGVVGYDGEDVVIEISEHIGRATNNVAEWKAVIAAMKAAIDLGEREIRIHADSQLVVEQFNGRMKCKSDTLLPLMSRARGLSKRFTTCIVTWVPREENRYADGLSVAGSYETTSEKE